MNAKQLIKDRFPVSYDFYVEYKDRKLYNSRKKLADISPETLVKFVYNKSFGQDIDLKNPQTFNEKLNWLKLYWYDGQAEICSDKYLVREFVEKKDLDTCSTSSMQFMTIQRILIPMFYRINLF